MIVLSADEDDCRVSSMDGPRTVSYSAPFPRPRAGRIAPGNLVAVAEVASGFEVIVWRWFDAVVVSQVGQTVTLWEPNHGTVEATPRDASRVYRPGNRAYLSGGLPGAEWWVAGHVVDQGESADVDIDAVDSFFTMHGLWDKLA